MYASTTMKREDRDRIHSEVVGRVVNRVLAARGRQVAETINETLYHEKQRLRRGGDGKRAAADRAFIGKLRSELPRASEARLAALVREVVERYESEVIGNFDQRVYALATRAIPVALGALLNGLSPRRVLSRLGEFQSLDDHVLLEGETETIRRLSERGTIVLTPTHSSNLDSIILGYVIYRLGLPPFIYGAGLNLFTNPMIGFFMRNLGAYTVDRLKTDPLYRETLKEHSTVTLEAGYHTLFFPGGTRSRSGAVETHLKKGLLGTAVTALRNASAAGGRPRPIYVVPCTISYPLVLEAATLIEDYLKESGKARYIIVDDEFSQIRRWFDYIRELVSLDMHIRVRFGSPCDVVGNDVDPEGLSRDPRGRPVEASRYFMADGAVSEDPVRDAEFTKLLAARVREGLRRENVALATGALAYVVFDMLRRQSGEDDLYRFLRTVGPEASLSLPEVERQMDALVKEMSALAGAGRLRLGRALSTGDTAEIVRSALRVFGTYHTTPVIERRGVRLHVTDANLLFYYRNRLDGYGLLGAPALVPPGREA